VQQEEKDGVNQVAILPRKVSKLSEKKEKKQYITAVNYGRFANLLIEKTFKITYNNIESL
jgi:hypothetical protein